jgi:serine/threonine protein kinase/serine phosphatase RsbU (regulator of sigma subunit)
MAIRFRREAAIIARLEHPSLVKIYGIGEHENRPFVVMDFIEGQSLAKFLEKGELSEDLILKIAKCIAGALTVAHKHGVIHRDIKPDNILIGSEEKVTLIDFGFADEAATTTDTAIGTFAYSPPEQTGFLKRPVDGRSDLYSLGAVLYQCVTGRPVFIAESVTDLIKKHAVVSAPDVRETKPATRPSLAMIIAKLLSKDPDDRYQTAEGLLFDLEKIADLEVQMKSGELKLDKKSGQIRVVHEMPLIGRDKELDFLKKSWSEVLLTRGALIQLEGEGGAGKTRLTQELLNFSNSPNLILLRSKCQDNDTVPLGPVREAIDNYILQVFRLPDNEREQKLEYIKQTGGEHGAFLHRLSKGLAQVFPEGTTDMNIAQDQFYDIVADFLVGLSRSHPLLLLIDDTQWIDATSSLVLSRVMKRAASLPVLILTTARNDSGSIAASKLFFETVASERATRIELQPFDAKTVALYARAFLGGEGLDGAAVTKLQTVTNGNVFALNEYLRSLMESGSLTPNGGRWIADMEQLTKLTLSNNVIPLVVNRLKRLSPPALDILMTAALSGIRFKLQLLTAVSGKKSSEMTNFLDEGVRANIIERQNEEYYAIVHDRVREALIEGISPEELKDRHQALADALIMNEEQSADYFFGLAHHLINGHPERHPLKVSEICLRAGKLALDTFSNQQAYKVLMQGYLARKAAIENGISVSDSTELDEMLATAAYRTVRLAEAHEHLTTCMNRAKSNEDLRRAYILRAMNYVAEGKFDDAWAAILKTLELLGRPVPENKIVLFISIVWYWLLGRLLERSSWLRKINFKKREERATISRMGAIENQVCFMRGRLDLSVYFASRNYVNALLLGPSSEMAQSTSFNSYGHGLFQKYVFRVPEWLEFYSPSRKKAVVHHYGQKAINIAEQVGDANMVTICIYNLGNTIQYAGDTIASEKLIRHALTRNKKVSNFTLCGVNIMILSWLLDSRGLSREVIDLVENEKDAVQKCNNVFYQTVAFGTSYVALSLQGRTREAAAMRSLSQMAATKYPPFPWMQASLIIFDLWIALDLKETSQQSDELINRFLAMKFKTPYCNHVYALIAYIRYYQFLKAKREKQTPEHINFQKAMADLKHYGNNPVISCHYWILNAGLNQDNLHKSLQMLDKARALALESDSKWGMYEAAAQMAMTYKIANDLVQARSSALGALEIANSQGWANRASYIKSEFGLLDSPERSSNVSTGQMSAKSIMAERYVDSLLRISLASSSTLDPVLQSRAALDELIKVLNAERGLFFLCDPQDESKLVLSAGRDGMKEITDMRGYSTTVITKVKESKKPLVVSGTDQGEILGSESVVAHNLRSIIAAPIMHREKFVGVIYLDSRVAKGIFSEEDLKILSAISNHIAIAIETARMAQVELNAKVLERDLALTGAVQSYFLPAQDSLVSSKFKLCGYYKPCSQAGGDWWWYHQDKVGSLYILVGDVTGHGAAPAMLTASTAAQMNNILTRDPNVDMSTLLQELNSGFRYFAKGNYLMTMSAAMMDVKDSKLKWWAAAAPPLMVLKNNGECNVLTATGSLMGQDEFSPGYTEVALNSGDRIIFFTDGLSELQLPNGLEIRLRQLQKIFIETKTLSCEDARKAIIEAIDKARQDVPLNDDLTFVIVDCL